MYCLFFVVFLLEILEITFLCLFQVEQRPLMRREIVPGGTLCEWHSEEIRLSNERQITPSYIHQQPHTISIHKKTDYTNKLVVYIQDSVD